VPLQAAAILHALSGPTAGAAGTASSGNPVTDQLIKLSPADQAARLADFLGDWCIGTKPFLMGVTKEGPSKGYAYWSLECVGNKSYAIQITPIGQKTAIDCDELKESGKGRECYKPF
jgi:hypothetical protein